MSGRSMKVLDVSGSKVLDPEGYVVVESLSLPVIEELSLTGPNDDEGDGQLDFQLSDGGLTAILRACGESLKRLEVTGCHAITGEPLSDRGKYFNAAYLSRF